MKKNFDRPRRFHYGVLAGFLCLAGCGPHGGPPPAPPPLEVTTFTVTPRDVPVSMQYVGQTESSRLVEIRARVDGYLLKKFYAEGELVRQGEPLFQIDPRPFQVAAESAEAAVKDKENSVSNARLTLDRMKLLVAENAVSRKDADDALAAEKSALSALALAKADRSRAEMNLSYARITSPVTGLAGRATQAEGSYISPGGNGQLTTVAQVDPIWVNFSISESEWLRFKEQIHAGTLRFPKNFDFDVEMIQSDGSVLPKRGKINFSAPSVDTQTGTYAVRATFANTNLAVSPGQFVRVRLNGALRPGAILVPQRAVLQGQAGKFVYVVNADNKAEVRPVEVGDWHGDQWFVNSGLRAGERIVVGGVVKVQPGAPLKVTAAPATESAPAASPKQ